jgi:hypothetical protein
MVLVVASKCASVVVDNPGVGERVFVMMLRNRV